MPRVENNVQPNDRARQPSSTLKRFSLADTGSSLTYWSQNQLVPF